MQIYVCVKHVPDSAARITIRDKNQFDESVVFLINPYDENAIEEALRLKERTEDSEVVIVTLGKEKSHKYCPLCAGHGGRPGNIH